MKRISILPLFILCCALLAAQTSDGSDWFWGKPVTEVSWEGLAHADRSQLDALTRPYIGKTFTEELWLELQSKLYELDWFENIEPRAVPMDEAKSKVRLFFAVREKPSIDVVKISGNSGIKTKDLLEVVSSKSGDIFSQSRLRLDELSIRKLYLEKGFPDASVSAESSSSPTMANAVIVSFAVNEGTRVAVKEIQFTGNKLASSQTLKAKMQLKEANLFRSGAFQESKLEEDKQAIADYYKSIGHVDAAVVDVIRSYEKDPKSGKNWLVLTMAINEGGKWYYGGISFEGNRIFGADKLAALITLKPGAVLDYKKLMAGKQKIDDLYYESGYIFNSIDLSERRDTEKSVISYRITIVERDRAHIENIVIRGNKKTKDYVLYRELPLQVGDIFSKAKIIEGLRNLYNLQYFSSVAPEMSPGSAEGLMNLAFNVEEQSTADIQFGVTLSGIGNPDVFPLSGLIKWNDRNFLGRGFSLTAELNASPTDQSLRLGFNDAWLFGNRFAGGIDFSVSHSTKTTGQDVLAPIFQDGVPDPFTSPKTGGYSISEIPAAYRMSYDSWDIALSLTTGRGFSSPAGLFGVGGGYTIGLGMTSYDDMKYRPASSYLRESNGIWNLSNRLVFRAYLNNLDLWYNPSKGYYISQRFTWVGFFPFEKQHYLRSDTKLEGFVTLFNVRVFEGWNFKWVLGAHTGFSYLLPLPVAGGYRKVTDDWLSIDGTFNARGWNKLYGFHGIGLWENWVELRMPIFENFLWIDAFLDMAVLATDGGLLNVAAEPAVVDESRPGFGSLGGENLAFSVGFGFRFSIPQFPFRFYFAKRFAIQDGEGFFKTDKGMDFVISITQQL